MAPVSPPLPTPWNLPFQSRGSQTSKLISFSMIPTTRQNGFCDPGRPIGETAPPAVVKSEGGYIQTGFGVTCSTRVIRVSGNCVSLSLLQSAATACAERQRGSRRGQQCRPPEVTGSSMSHRCPYGRHAAALASSNALSASRASSRRRTRHAAR